MKSSNITAEATHHPHPHHQPPPPKKKERKYSFISKLKNNSVVSKNVQNMKPEHIAQVSLFCTFFARVSYFARFSRLNIFSKGLFPDPRV